jgi:hypothetical protein
MRECRDSDIHPISLPIIVGLDTTGSMATVPRIIQGSLNKLMGTFLDDKASGKRYLGDAYPAIMISCVDDYDAMYRFSGSNSNGEGALQTGQFESGLEIDDNLGKIWFTRNGGGNGGESYDLLFYFAARHTVHDHWEKRKRKGYMFIIGDENWFDNISTNSVNDVIGDRISTNLKTVDIAKEVQSRYHVYFIMPNMTDHWHDKSVEEKWKSLIGAENFIRLEKPDEICTLIAALVAVNEGAVSIDDLCADGVCGEVTNALVPFAQANAGNGNQAVATVAANLPAMPNTGSKKSKGAQRL